ncbi:hypothetical protein GUJ93_ZPchr0010g10379 [Zizania palustris]|uniref:Uncharacterized protein n=1 Tax=Zizania palustris TaxID=103762 RepID=A0A8J5W8M9_ZIZPA|nr:hypothetical protein GUJ93_ZPchr0010g10379 [Zizania palustris]
MSIGQGNGASARAAEQLGTGAAEAYRAMKSTEVADAEKGDGCNRRRMWPTNAGLCLRDTTDADAAGSWGLEADDGCGRWGGAEQSRVGKESCH